MCRQCGCNEHSDHNSQVELIDIQRDVLANDNACADQVREHLEKSDVHMVNIIGSPGSGKTELICALISRIQAKGLSCVVIEGDLATDNDADRIKQSGAPAYQIKTGTACHLSAHDIQHALEHLPLIKRSLVLVENVGNLVCPSMFYLGESLRVVCLSVTEGTDKPQKYPSTFQSADLVAITKHDLLPYVDFDMQRSVEMIDHIKPKTPCLITSARSGHGLEEMVVHLESLWK
jgi:hydrogenase nickel incorporation protein HypB